MNAENSDWGPCPPGTLESVVARVSGEKRFRRTVVSGALLAVCLVLIGGSAFVIRSNTEPSLSECQQAAIFLPDYVAGRLENDQMRMVEAHLRICERCRSKLEEMRSMHVVNSACDRHVTAKNLIAQNP